MLMCSTHSFKNVVLVNST